MSSLLEVPGLRSLPPSASTHCSSFYKEEGQVRLCVHIYRNVQNKRRLCVYVREYKLLPVWFKVDLSVIFFVFFLSNLSFSAPCRNLWFHQQPSSIHVDQSSAVYQQRCSGTTETSFTSLVILPSLPLFLTFGVVFLTVLVCSCTVHSTA